MIVTYSWYTAHYGCDLSEAAFVYALPEAERHVNWLCGGRRPCGAAEHHAYKRAICAAVQAFVEYGEGPAGGFQIGGFRMGNSEASASGPTGEDMASDAAIKELAGTGLIFCGVR